MAERSTNGRKRAAQPTSFGLAGVAANGEEIEGDWVQEEPSSDEYQEDEIEIDEDVPALPPKAPKARAPKASTSRPVKRDLTDEDAALDEDKEKPRKRKKASPVSPDAAVRRDQHKKVEAKRRQTINGHIDQIKALLPSPAEPAKEGSKADILENAYKHILSLQKSRAALDVENEATRKQIDVLQREADTLRSQIAAAR